MPPPTQQPRFNAKARGSVAGGSHKKRKRPKTHLGKAEDGKHEVDQIKEELTIAAEGISGRGKMSAKKRKRLDSYIVRPHTDLLDSS